MLTEGNFQKWPLAVKAYLTPQDQVRVIKRVKNHGWCALVAFGR